MGGRFIAVVGPSGVGKDSLIDGLIAARPDLTRVRRVITRDPDAGGEEIEAVSPALFSARAAGGDFVLHWQAHGLSYGIPKTVLDELKEGRDVIANLSRAMLAKAGSAFDDFLVLNVTASPAVLARRLQNRGRESGADISRRLARRVPDMPDGLRSVQIDNSGRLEEAIATALAALYPERV